MNVEEFILPLNGLHTGKTSFSWYAGKAFFEEFGNDEVLDAELEIDVEANKSGDYLGVDCLIKGSITVACYRCSDDLVLPVESIARLSIKFGDEPTEPEFNENDREVIYLPNDEGNMDMKQIIYDYSLLSLPMHKCHKDGECNPEAMKYLGVKEKTDTVNTENSPFAALKDLFKN